MWNGDSVTMRTTRSQTLGGAGAGVGAGTGAGVAMSASEAVLGLAMSFNEAVPGCVSWMSDSDAVPGAGVVVISCREA